MMIVALLSLLTGAVLGMRFKVLVLLPAIAAVLPIALGAGIVRDHAFGPAMLIGVAAVASLQIGYLAGVGVRHALAVARLRGLRGASVGSPVRRPAH